jgi:hypothetical protein
MTPDPTGDEQAFEFVRSPDNTNDVVEVTRAELVAAREEFALTVEEAALATLARDREALLRGAALGVPLLEDEVALVSRRFDFQSAATDVISQWREDPFPGFGGAWIDFNTQTLLAAGTGEIPDVSARLPEGSRLVEVPVEFDYQQLISVAEAVRRDKFTMVEGVEILGVSAHEGLNKVVVSTTADLRQIDDYERAFWRTVRDLIRHL